MLFPGAVNAFLERRLLRLLLLLLLALPLPLQRDLGCWPWCCEPLEYYSISVLGNHTVPAVSWHCNVGHDCKSLRLPELQPLILRSGQFYSKNCILIAFATSVVMYLLRNSVITMRFLFIWVVTEWIQLCQKDCLSSFVILFSSPNQSTLQN